MAEEPRHHEREHHETEPHHKVYEVKTLLKYTAPGRPFKKRTKSFYMSGFLIALFIEIILFLFSQQMLMLVVLSLVFVGFALASIPPLDTEYKISTEGITIDDHFYLWQELYDFYFKEYFGTPVVHIRTHYFVPGEIALTLGGVSTDTIKNILVQYLPYREIVKPSFMEKSGDWLSKTFPLERPVIETKKS